MKKLCAMIFVILAVSAHLLAEETVYKIGDEGPGGGIVFYYSKAGFPVKDPFSLSPKIYHYLECSSVDLGCVTWCPKKRDKDCCVVQTFGRYEDSVGAGLVNTANILKAEHKGGELTVSNCAAKLCSSYFTGTTKPGEWYLPSKLELELIEDNLISSGIIIKRDRYWSSSQDLYNDEEEGAYYLEYVKSGCNVGHMSWSCRVRAVRAF